MKLVLDTSDINFIVGSQPEPVIDYASKRPKADENGSPLYSVQLIAFYTDRGRQRSEVISVKLPDPKPLSQGTPVQVFDLIANPWVQDGRNGIAYRASAIETLVPAKA